ncbi:unnamed protein product, partial [Brassica rapa subsp. trilocularis]
GEFQNFLYKPQNGYMWIALSFDPYLKCVCGLIEPNGNKTNF